MIIVNRRAVDDDGNLGQLIDRVQTQSVEPHAARKPTGQVRISTCLAAVRIGGDESRHREACTLHQAAAQRFTYNMLPANLPPAFDRDVAQDDGGAATEVNRRDGVGPAAANRLDRNDVGVKVLLSPGPHPRRIHASRIDAGLGQLRASVIADLERAMREQLSTGL